MQIKLQDHTLFASHGTTYPFNILGYFAHAYPATMLYRFSLPEMLSALASLAQYALARMLNSWRNTVFNPQQRQDQGENTLGTIDRY